MISTTSTEHPWPTVEDLSAEDGGGNTAVRLDERLNAPIGGDSLEVDRDNRVVRDVAITGSISRNGYRYDLGALERAAPLYVGRPVFLDHAIDPERPQSRSTRDLVGTVENAVFESGDDEGMIRGDIRVLDTDSGRLFLTLCESDGPGVGMSHVVLARRNEDGSVVEAIEKVVSVDAVVFPATTNRLSEQEETDAGEVSTADRPTCDVCRDVAEKLVCSKSECETLKARIREMEHDRRTSERERLLTESRLPREAVSGVFREQVYSAADLEAAKRLVSDREALVRAFTSGPVSDDRGAVGERRRDGFVEAIRGRG